MMIFMIVVMVNDYADDYIDNNLLYDANYVRAEHNWQWQWTYSANYYTGRVPLYY